jgi:glutathione synthase/RimK-type ligase-like ATP-grasp enzyme
MSKNIVVEINHELKNDEILYYSQRNILKKNCTIQFGNMKTKAKVINHILQSIKVDHLELSLEIAKKLKLPMKQISLVMTTNYKSNQISLGPIIGIFIKRKKTQKQISSVQIEIIRHYLINAKSLKYFAYAFCAEDIDFDKRTIHGFILDENQQIIKRTVPFPNVIYDQNCSRTYEKQANVILALQKLYDEVPYYFNPGYLNKWEIFEYISNHEIAKRYHPPTILLEDVTSVSKEVKKHGLIYLKPINGSQGKGIITITKKNNYYEYKHQGSMLIEGKCINEKKLQEVISNTIKQRKYIIQKGLHLIKYNNCPVDIRVLMQKNEHGKWIRTKLFARVSKPGSITSNLSMGGEAKTLDEVLRNIFSNSMIISIKNKLRTASRIIANALEEKSEKNFGELGLDLGITENGQIWLIEINSKPWKTVETKSGTKELVEKSFKRPIEYAGYLAYHGYKNEV